MKRKIFAAIAAMMVICSVNTFALDYTSPEVIKNVQSALNNAGYDCGTPDGVAGQGTKSQIEKYKADNGLSGGSEIDAELCQALGLETETGSEPEATSAPDINVHIESKYGILDYVRYEVNEDKLFLVFDYQNTTDDTVYPVMQYIANAFQHGRELENGFSMSLPSDCENSSVQIRPGASIRFCYVHNLADKTPVEVEAKAIWDFTGETKQVFTIDFDNTEEGSADSSAPVAETVEGAGDSSKELEEANQKIAELEKQLEEANAKIEELQGQLDTIKAALGN